RLQPDRPQPVGVEREADDLLRPVRIHPLAQFDDDLLTIQKYAGKTNEQFTKLLLNATLLASSHAPKMLDGHLVVLDPLCGRGTTLNQALMYGYDAIGIDTDGKDFDIYSAFIRTWLKRKRIKHRAEIAPVRKDKKTLARRMTIDVGADQRLVVYHADSTQAREFLKGGIADVIVADLPYGVTHGSRTTGAGLSRSPLRLLRDAVPVWSQLIQPGGTIGISWNTHVTSRTEAVAVFEENGLRVVAGNGYDDLAHWVDQSIDRDVLVARKV
ncbi:MAG TPA: SAM-dependent methyltransferase, partial [Micromonosporaceae bacterium]